MTVTNGLHKDAADADLHTAWKRSYADATARLAGTYTAADNNHLFLQLDDSSLWILSDYTGPTFVAVGNSAALLSTNNLSDLGNDATARANLGQEASTDVASGSTTNIGAANSTLVKITGTTTITAFDSVAAGIWRVGYFAGALTLTHNATSLILPGAANIITAAGDAFIAESLGSGNWKVLIYQKADGTPIAGGGGGSGRTLIAENTPSSTGTTNFSIPSGHKKITIEFAVRSTNSSNDVDGYIKFNSDTTTGNYYYNIQRNNQFGVSNDSGASYIFGKTSIPGANADTNGFCEGLIEITQYDNPNFFKVALIKFGTWDNAFTQMITGALMWKSTSAITSIDIALSAGNFATNSVLRAYYED